MAYTNFQHCTEEEYTNIIYSQDAKNKIKILFNNVELANADRYCEKLTRKERILPDDSSKRFSLDNFISQEVELILHDVDSSVIKDQVSISIGTLVDENNDVYEYVPLGIFNIQDTPTTDKNKITVKLRDNRVKFDFNYNGKELIDAHDGSATKLQILQDICSKAGVQTTITSFAGDSDLIGIYDNTITATTYISYLAEQAGAIAKIDREGKLIFTYLTDSKNATIAGSGSISDSFNGGLISTQVEGKAEQHSYSGKNKFDYKSASNVNNTGVSTYRLFEINGLKPNTQYNINRMGFTEKLNNQYCYLWDNIVYASANRLPLCTPAYLYNKVDFISNNEGKMYLAIYPTGTNVWQELIPFFEDAQIEEGSSETSYEPFTNNLPTPNPYYPEEIKTVSGIGNLFDINEDVIKNNGCTLSVNNNQVITTVTNAGNSRFGVIPIPNSNELLGKTVTLSVDMVASASNNGQVVLFTIDDNGANKFQCGLVRDKSGSKTITLPDSYTNGATQFGLFFYANNNGTSAIGDTVTYSNIQLKIGDAAHTPVPYGHWLPIKVQNKNLFDKNNTGILVGYNLSGSTGATSTNSSRNTSYYIELKPNTTYTLSGATYTSKCFYDSSKTFINSTAQNTFTTPNNTAYLRFAWNNTVDYTYMQLEENSTSTNYIAHQEQTTLIDLNKYDGNNNIIGNYEICTTLTAPSDNLDVLTIKDGRAVLTKRMEKYVVDENTLFGSATQLVGLFWIYKAFTFVSYRGISNFFVNNPDTRINSNAPAFQYLNDGQFAFRWSTTPSNRDRVYFKYLDLGSDTNAFKNWAIENKLTLYYRQNVETIILRGTYDINLYEGVNYISIEDELEPTMNITYSIEKTPKRIPLSIVEKYEIGEPYSIERIVYEDAIRKYQTSRDETLDTLYINSANPYINSEIQVDNISARTKNFIIDSVNTGKILGNPALDSYDLIEVYDDYSQETTKPIIFRTLANNILTYNGVLISEYDTQIGKEERTENVTIVGEPAFQKWAKAQINNVESNVSIQTGRVDSLEDGMKNVYTIEQVNELVQDAERGVTNTFTKAGGNNIFRNTGLWFAQNDSNNPYEFWSGNVSRVKEDKAYNKNALSLQNSTLSQEQSIPNGDYTVSFIYKKLINLANVIVRINGVEYTLDSTEDKEFEENIIVSSQNIKIEFISDTANSCEIYDLMVNAGTVKLAYSQNQNETTTDTVNISKGITITSSDLDVKFKADADGIRTLDSNNTELTKFTDVGMTTKEAIIQSKSQIVGTLWQEVEEQTWITRL